MNKFAANLWGTLFEKNKIEKKTLWFMHGKIQRKALYGFFVQNEYIYL